MLRFREEGMETFTIGPEAGKIYQSKRSYPCKADRGIDSVTVEVRRAAGWAGTGGRGSGVIFRSLRLSGL